MSWLQQFRRLLSTHAAPGLIAALLHSHQSCSLVCIALTPQPIRLCESSNTQWQADMSLAFQKLPCNKGLFRALLLVCRGPASHPHASLPCGHCQPQQCICQTLATHEERLACQVHRTAQLPRSCCTAAAPQRLASDLYDMRLSTGWSCNRELGVPEKCTRCETALAHGYHMRVCLRTWCPAIPEIGAVHQRVSVAVHIHGETQNPA